MNNVLHIRAGYHMIGHLAKHTGWCGVLDTRPQLSDESILLITTLFGAYQPVAYQLVAYQPVEHRFCIVTQHKKYFVIRSGIAHVMVYNRSSVVIYRFYSSFSLR